MHPFRRLKVWHKAHALSIACHNATFRRPVGGTAPGFRSQFLRAVDSIMDNIAEGAGQQSQRQFAKYLDTAIASANEVDNQIERARSLRIFEAREARKLLEQLWEVRRMLTALHRAVKRRADEDDRCESNPPDAASAAESPPKPASAIESPHDTSLQSSLCSLASAVSPLPTAVCRLQFSPVSPSYRARCAMQSGPANLPVAVMRIHGFQNSISKPDLHRVL